MCSGYQLSDSDPTSVTDMAPKVHIDIHIHVDVCSQTHPYIMYDTCEEAIRDTN